MTVKEIIALLQALPPDYEIAVDRGGAYESAQSIERQRRAALRIYLQRSAGRRDRERIPSHARKQDSMSHTPSRRPSCQRCGKKHLGTFVWLELDSVTLLYAMPGTITAADSQGLFPFGVSCAHRVLMGSTGRSLTRTHPTPDGHPAPTTDRGTR